VAAFAACNNLLLILSVVVDVYQWVQQMPICTACAVSL
jgi:hypothetical protein